MQKALIKCIGLYVSSPSITNKTILLRLYPEETNAKAILNQLIHYKE